MAVVLRSDNTVDVRRWADIIEVQREKLTAYLTTILHCQYLAEDALQETYIRLSKMPDEQDQAISNRLAYCYQTARNIAIDMVRKKSKESWVSLDSAQPGQYTDKQVSAEETLIEQNLDGCMMQAVSSLSKRHQNILSLYKRGDYKQKDIAKICAISPTLVNFIIQEVIVTCQTVLAH
ncbi:RNA polymerase sigma factor [Pseudoalteromonas piscicida]|uniref:Sigma-70 family RNA polymerase sigma factor n=1 Tax=Pseudoalteromonas piscicida TaxID=43662 RepID=A0AAD0REG2_PSEO7|nr:sigma-70 family RNA polymerase sigma factor [Pseudoalteromonas piscicida]ASD65701.1 DNA-directed RNA polymerase subunit sigma-70 [Pseudoalteromonas piscicida]AXQ96455.1 sigma-70 family RNA polymerase sigma factor [Pseudoalteromonas piscicida]AXR00737.1 sigma-70 family RNA polymerase sigma factor [Pseudoalteromonas piscicida]